MGFSGARKLARFGLKQALRIKEFSTEAFH
jgi:hypothetical protein